MSAAGEESLTTCSELVDIKPDISVLCHETNADCVDIKPEITSDNTPTANSLQLDSTGNTLKTCLYLCDVINAGGSIVRGHFRVFRRRLIILLIYSKTILFKLF